jgi:hypothetical protein
MVTRHERIAQLRDYIRDNDDVVDTNFYQLLFMSELVDTLEDIRIQLQLHHEQQAGLFEAERIPVDLYSAEEEPTP